MEIHIDGEIRGMSENLTVANLASSKSMSLGKTVYLTIKQKIQTIYITFQFKRLSVLFKRADLDDEVVHLCLYGKIAEF